ncbi:DNA repair protein [Podosphaera aphanis]|nr:DNA repair protein [Podosphaera aphanis]
MGVTGLWPILAPSARPTPLPTLNRKRLAVDASIWIYQFLKAVRDKEGNALPNSHIVGFFRRICKLLYFGIKPVFVFDGGAPILKRQTIRERKERREGRREDAVRTAGKLLALQMKRMGEEKEKTIQNEDQNRDFGEEESIPAGQDLVYVGEMGLSAQERAAKRKFRKTDEYDLPELTNGIEGMGQPNDPRIMTTEELEEYARQFSDGQDINLYDFSKIDYDGDFFMSLPAGDRYNILNAARLRSRLRMGLSKKQLEDMFPDRMAFSRFQIERVRERNELTQRLMNLNGMNGDLGIVIGRRISGEAGREYVLVKNEGVEGGWALGVVNTDNKKVGERNVPIDVDALGRQKSISPESEDEEEFEDVPVEGLNRLPKISNINYNNLSADEIGNSVERSFNSRVRDSSNDPDSLFVVDNSFHHPEHTNQVELNRETSISLQCDDELSGSEDDHLQKAIALSLQKNFTAQNFEQEIFEDLSMQQYEQQAVQAPQPLKGASGQIIAHIVNNRANAAVIKRKVDNLSDSDSDGEGDLRATLALARKQKASQKSINPVAWKEKDSFISVVPFEKLGSVFSKDDKEDSVVEPQRIKEDTAGGFDNDINDEKSPKPIPPWLLSQDDIRSELELRRKRDFQMDTEDRDIAAEQVLGKEKIPKFQDPVIIDSSEEEDDEEADVILLDPPSSKLTELVENIRSSSPIPRTSQKEGDSIEYVIEQAEIAEKTPDAIVDPKIDQMGQTESRNIATPKLTLAQYASPETSPQKSAASMSSPIFEDVQIPDSTEILSSNHTSNSFSPPSPITSPGNRYNLDRAAIDAEFDNASDPEDEELLAQLALEAEEHGRFASTLNNKSELENRHDYESELQALRSQQKKDRRDADEVSQTMVIECQALLRLFGLPYITAPMEAEAQCAELVRLGLVDGVVTDDCDIFLFGGTRVYKNMFNSNKFVECYLASDIEKELSLSREQLVSIAHLLGSDYTEGLPGIGPVTALEIISEFPSICEFASWWSIAQNSTDPEESIFRKKFRRRQAAKLFLPPGFPSQAVTEAYWQPQVNSDNEEFQWGVPDLERLREFLMATIGWCREKTDEVLVPVIRDMNRRAAEGTQSNITHFFAGGLGAGVRGPVGGTTAAGGSKRMRAAVGKLKARKQGAGRLDKTFGDEAREWVQRENSGKNKGSQALSTRSTKRKRTRVARRRSETPVSDASDEAQEDQSEQELEPEESNDEPKTSHHETSPSTARRKGNKKARVQ